MHSPQAITQQPTRAVVATILEQENLPATDLTDLHLNTFFYAGPSDAPTGIVGLEVYDADALLRSLVVRGGARSSGLGTTLVAHAENYARSHGVHSLYLL